MEYGEDEFKDKRLRNLIKSCEEMLRAKKNKQTPQLKEQIKIVEEKIRKITESNVY